MTGALDKTLQWSPVLETDRKAGAAVGSRGIIKDQPASPRVPSMSCAQMQRVMMEPVTEEEDRLQLAAAATVRLVSQCLSTEPTRLSYRFIAARTCSTTSASR